MCVGRFASAANCGLSKQLLLFDLQDNYTCFNIDQGERDSEI